MRFNNYGNKTWDWTDDQFLMSTPEQHANFEAMSRKLQKLAEEYSVKVAPTKTEEFPLGEVFFHSTKTDRAPSTMEIKVQKPRPASTGEVFIVDYEGFNGMGPIRKNGQIWDFKNDRPFFTGTDNVTWAISDDFYDTMAMCFGLTKSANEKPVLNDRPYHKGYPDAAVS